MSNIKGLGGIFIKSTQHEKLKTWYKKNLHIDGVFQWQDTAGKKPYHTMWNVLPADAKIFEGTSKEYVFSYVVDDLEGMIQSLTKKGIMPITPIGKDEIGTSGHLLDPEGNKVILWQPDNTIAKAGLYSRDRVTGIGGVFFKSQEPKVLGQWYAENLGINATEWGYNFEWHDPNDPDEKEPATTVWNPFKADTNYFSPSVKDFMFNYRVVNLPDLIKKLEEEGVEIAGKLEEHSYGKFGWIMDIDGNKIELWEP